MEWNVSQVSYIFIHYLHQGLNEVDKSMDITIIICSLYGESQEVEGPKIPVQS